ncbi:MAG: TatD family hydrolase [Lachnospiraceae bacterium]|nr:TatD family hydrolase [Lachnospiraceae bacterium]
MIFDSHAHYDDAQFDEDRVDVLSHLKDAGVERVVNISNGWDDLLKTLDLIKEVPFLYGTVGVHPCKVSELNEARMEQMKDFCSRDKIVAVGEIGLDYYWMSDPKDVQKEWFVRQLRLAKEVNLPVVIHSRDASQDTFDIMKAEHAGTTGGVIHCYSGSLEMAREYVKMGYYLGIGGVVTFKNSKTLKKVAVEIPLENIVVETDCPYLAPTPHRGKRNSSAYLPLVIEEIARLRDISPEEVEQVTYENAKRLYGIKN